RIIHVPARQVSTYTAAPVLAPESAPVKPESVPPKTSFAAPPTEDINTSTATSTAPSVLRPTPTLAREAATRPLVPPVSTAPTRVGPTVQTPVPPKIALPQVP